MTILYQWSASERSSAHSHMFCGSFLPSGLHPVVFPSSAAAWHQGTRKSLETHNCTFGLHLRNHQCLCFSCTEFALLYSYYFWLSWTKQNVWVVIWCWRHLLFDCVKQQSSRFRVITILHFRERHRAFLHFLWVVFEFDPCFVVFVPSH